MKVCFGAVKLQIAEKVQFFVDMMSQNICNNLKIKLKIYLKTNT